jgi:predicted nucleotidyltransferase
MSVLHARIRMPLSLAVALPAGAYLARSIARGFDFKPDMPIDLVVLVMYVLVLSAAYASRRAAAKEAEREADEQDHDEGREP